MTYLRPYGVAVSVSPCRGEGAGSIPAGAAETQEGRGALDDLVGNALCHLFSEGQAMSHCGAIPRKEQAPHGLMTESGHAVCDGSCGLAPCPTCIESARREGWPG
jgi:hypothetical protein